ncbi:MAG: Major facilitator superfamily MFS1 [Syntrophaceae bacterium]|nr:MAG: Major facilitator superfamily MFS1 [Syntrophaceae bacterium]
MISPAKVLFYLIELINCYAAVYYSNFLFFYLRSTFGFGEVENLLTAALGGFVYIIAAWQGGKLAQRYGCIRMIYIGGGVIILSLTLGMVLPTPTAQIMVFCLWTVGVCFIWPALETLISERSGAKLAKMVGIYNVTWAAGSAVGYFTAGILIEKLGMASLFWLPLGLTAVELVLLPCAAKLLKKENDRPCQEENLAAAVCEADAKKFLRMAWIANPFSYVAINTVIPLIPSIAEKLSLSTGMAGIVCSLWMFARLVAFAAFWRWTGWHYRFRWLAGSFLLLIVCFFGLLMSPSIGLLLVAQVGFGLSVGLIYYSSLYYSMNVTENHGSNAGLHEAMIGVGLFVGPAVGAATLYLVPTAIGIGVWSVGGLLCVGFSSLLFVRPFK